MLSYKFENPNSKIGDQQIHDWSSTFVVFRRLFVFFAPFSAASTRSVRLHPHSPINMQRCLDIFLHWSTVQCIGKVFFIKLLLKPEGHRWWPVVCFRKHETASVFFLLLFCVTLSIQVLICKVFSPPMFSLGNVSSFFSNQFHSVLATLIVTLSLCESKKSWLDLPNAVLSQSIEEEGGVGKSGSHHFDKFLSALPPQKKVDLFTEAAGGKMQAAAEDYKKVSRFAPK